MSFVLLPTVLGLVASVGALWDNNNWVLSTEQLERGFQARPSLANGYIGCSVSSLGPWFEPGDGINGWPLDNPRQTFCTVAGFFNLQANTTRTNFPSLLVNGAESVIAGLPSWPDLTIAVGEDVLNAATNTSAISDFISSRSFKTGLQTWNYTWTTGNHDIRVGYEMFVHRSRVNVAAIRMTLASDKHVDVQVTDRLDERGAVRSDGLTGGHEANTIFATLSPHWLNATAWIFSTVNTTVPSSHDANVSISRSWNVTLEPNRPVIVTKYVGIASSDGFEDPRSTAHNGSLHAAFLGFDCLLDESTKAWATLVHPNFVDDYSLPDGTLPTNHDIVDMQIISKANAHYLLQNLLLEDGSDLNRWSISVGGLTSDTYAGLVFWDAEIFISPGVAVSHPSYAAQIPKYRRVLAEQAEKNARDNGYSNRTSIYPWTSGRFGNCTATGPCTDYQYHINSDIFLTNLIWWRITGDDTWFEKMAIPVNQAIVEMFSELVQYNQTSDLYSIKNMTDPDEYANHVVNGAFTLGSLAEIIGLTLAYASEFNLSVGQNWSHMAERVALPFAPSGLLTEFLQANNTAVIKQDDVGLLDYPFGYTSPKYTPADRLESLDYYATKQSPDGPAMTYSMYSISENALATSGCAAYTYALQGFLPYVRGPWYQFSEQQVDEFDLNGGTNPAFPFLTGAGGWHQIGPMGWLGARFTSEQLVIKPSLPPQISHVSVRTIIFGGAGIKAEMNQTHTNLTRVAVPGVDSYADRPMPITLGSSPTNGTNLTISLGEMITVENRVYSDVATTPGNLVQCLPISSQSNAVGRFPEGVVDGGSNTAWQPSSRNATSLVVDTRSVPLQPITAIVIDWGNRPALHATVVFYNSTSTTPARAVDLPVGISVPYNATTDYIVQPYGGNLSYYALESSVWSGERVELTIEGCLAEGAPATVADWSILGVGAEWEPKAGEGERKVVSAYEATGTIYGSGIGGGKEQGQSVVSRMGTGSEDGDSRGGTMQHGVSSSSDAQPAHSSARVVLLFAVLVSLCLC